MIGKQKTFIEADYGELEKAISAAYGINFEFPPAEEVSNDTAWTTIVEPTELDKGDKARLEDGRYGFLTHALMNDMCAKGLLEPGNYVIKVSW